MGAGALARAADRILRRPPVLYGRIRALLDEQEGWSAERTAAWTSRRLARMLRLAGRLPGYAGGHGSDLASWPILAKADIAGRETAFGHRSMLPGRPAQTGGTTGRPLSLSRDLTSVAFEHASLDHLCAKAGLDLPRARVAVLRADFVKDPADRSPPYWTSPSPDRLLLSVFHLDAGTVDAYLEAIARFRPDVLMCYPSALGHLAGLALGARRQASIPFALASSEQLPAQTATAAKLMFGSTVIDFYGQAERLVASWGVDGGPHRLCPLYGVAEAIEEDGSSGLLGTSLWNDRQILVRYRIGDTLAFEDQGPGVGPIGPDRLFRPAGRASERIDLGDGRIVIGLNHIPRGVEGVASVQLRPAGPRAVEVLVVPAGGDMAAAEQRIRANCALKFPPDVMIAVREIETPVRIASGKAPLLLPA